ncbi:putative fungal zn(2)-cys(6) binuclear cluster domain protein [Rhizoctonia solani 123E]|uniref:Putative fungal zn(2)-cys(6) binuclear cluster domain protein n=1 Tax=Rhizoctonia solani 123E TaxID=1423351 RepID=A0A074RM79_9AGAM|nr:putative fungal zn(2)-cys(6) binuclear cluster domain protein [Rhizoctonia solani 123E]
MLLISNTYLAISRTTDYNLPQFATLQKQSIDRVREARARDDTELTRELALATMEHSHQVKLSEELVNLRQCLTALDVQLKYYACSDVLQSLITHRPMFLRYTLDFLSPQADHIMKSNKGTGLMRMYGVPDQLMFTLAKMNGLFEDFRNRVEPETIQELKQELAACRPVVSLDLGRTQF